MRLALAAYLSLVLFSANVQAAADGSAMPDSYAAPEKRIALPGGRTINLRCSGNGAQVVLFEAGTNADSSTWFRVLPMLQDAARVCAYDRAGYGFSEGGPMPRDLEADVTDLHALMRAAELQRPLILVGHSLGSNIVRQFAVQYPEDVAGLVLVDPPAQGEEAAMPAQWKREDIESRQKREALLEACQKSAEAGALMAGCLRPPPTWMGERVAAAVKANKSRPVYWQTLRSELAANQALFAAPVPQYENYPNIPIILLSAKPAYDEIPDDVRVVLEQALAQTRQRILAGSSRSKRIDVPDASHDIQLDQPEAVASAVMELLVKP